MRGGGNVFWMTKQAHALFNFYILKNHTCFTVLNKHIKRETIHANTKRYKQRKIKLHRENFLSLTIQ